MGLPEPAERHLVHNRRISCSGYVRADGHFDIEAELIDSKVEDRSKLSTTWKTLERKSETS